MTAYEEGQPPQGCVGVVLVRPGGHHPCRQMQDHGPVQGELP